MGGPLSNACGPQTLQLRRLYDLEAVAAALPGELRARVAALRPRLAPAGAEAAGGAAPAHVAILRAPARHKLRQLADTGLSDFDFDRIRTAVRLLLCIINVHRSIQIFHIKCRLSTSYTKTKQL